MLHGHLFLKVQNNITPMLTIEQKRYFPFEFIYILYTFFKSMLLSLSTLLYRIIKMKLSSRTLFTVVLFAALGLNAFADDTSINQAELQAFAAQKFHVDFNAQTDKSKADITKEFVQSAKLGDALLNGVMKNDIDFKIAQRQIATEIWAQKFLASAKVDDTAVKALYDKYQPKTAPAYKLRNILVNSEAKADTLIKTLSKIKDSSKRLAKFKEFVKTESEDIQTRQKEGNIDWINLSKLDVSIQTALKGKKNSDLAKAGIKNIGWQILLVEDTKPEHQASFQEAAPQLTMIAKRELLNQEIKKILEKK